MEREARAMKREIRKLEHEIRQWKLLCLLMMVGFVFFCFFIDTEYKTSTASARVPAVMTEICTTV